jgi:S-adenosylmethionine-dependent methyltransferase
MGAAADSTRRAGEVGSFGVARERWLGGLGNVRNVVRQEIITRQLRKHLPDRPGRVLDVGAGQGTQSLRLARAGHRVVAVEPDPQMRAQLRAALHADPADAGDRVKVVAGSVGDLDSAIAADGYDVVLCLGVLMYLPESRSAITELAGFVAPGGLLCVAVRTPVSAVWRPAARQDWPAALEALDESANAQAQGRDMRYLNEIGAPARTDNIDTLAEVAAESGLELVRWYGVRVAVDLAELDPSAPADPLQLAALLDVEEHLGATDPYRQLAQLAHLILRRPHPGLRRMSPIPVAIGRAPTAAK